MALKEYIDVQIIEKEHIDIKITEKEIVRCELRVIDILNYLEKTVVSGLIQEEPIRLSLVRFQTSKSYITGTIKFFLNGIKEKQSDITEINSTIFEIAEAILTDDDVEIEYLELS
jgi:hypothetical protein